MTSCHPTQNFQKNTGYKPKPTVVLPPNKNSALSDYIIRQKLATFVPHYMGTWFYLPDHPMLDYHNKGNRKDPATSPLSNHTTSDLSRKMLLLRYRI